MENEIKELKEEVVMLRNIIRLMLNNLEYKVNENLKQKELLGIFGKIIEFKDVVGGSDSMSLVCETIGLKEYRLSGDELEKLKKHLNDGYEVVSYVCSKR